MHEAASREGPRARRTRGETRDSHMLRTEGDEVPHGETTALNGTTKELTALGEADGVEMARGIEGGIEQIWKGLELFADAVDLVRCGSEERRSSAAALVSEMYAGKALLTIESQRRLPTNQRGDSRICRPTLVNPHDPHEWLAQVLPRFKVRLEGRQSWCIELVSKAVPDDDGDRLGSQW